MNPIYVLFGGRGMIMDPITLAPLSLATSSSFLPILALFLVLLLLYIYFYFPTWHVRHVPCALPKHPVLGHLLLLEKHQAEVFVNLARQHGPVYRFHVGRQPMVMVADAELCRELAIKKFKSAPNRSIPPAIESSGILKQALFFSRDWRWSSMRSIVLPLFHSEQRLAYLPLITRVMEDLVHVLQVAADSKTPEVNMSNYLLAAGMDLIGEAAFGTRFGLLDDRKLVGDRPDLDFVNSACAYAKSLAMDTGAPLSVVAGIFFPVLQKPLRFLLARIPGTGDWAQEANTSKFTKVLGKLVAERKQQEEADEKNDALSILLKASTHEELLTPSHVAALSFEILMAGSDTTANTLAFALYAIAAHPHVEKKLLEEIDAFARLHKPITHNDLNSNFPYIEQVIKETLRFYCPSPVVARELSNDMDIGGYHLPKGTWIWMALNAIMRDSKHYIDPEDFNPERFDPNCDENKRRHPFAYVPFGLGPRMCVGSKFSMDVAKLALIHLFQKFTFEHSPGMEKPLALQFGLVTKPKYGVQLKVQPRNKDII